MIRRLILFLIVCWLPSYMVAADSRSYPLFALTATAQFDTRANGSNTNGGCFDPGVSSPGTDYSQQASPQITYSDLTVGSTTTQYTSAGHPVTSALPGNCFIITSTVSGSCSAGTYEVLAQSGTTATADSALGTAGSVCGAALGGSLLTIAQALSLVNTSGQQHQVVWVCGGCGTGTFSISTVLNVAAEIQIWGYGSVHKDQGTKPIIESSTSGINMMQPGGYCWIVDNVELLAQTGFNQYGFLLGNNACLLLQNSRLIGNGTSNTVAIDAYHSGVAIQVVNSEISNWNYGIYDSNNSSPTPSVTVVNSYIHNNTYGLTDGGTQGSGTPYTWISINSVWDSNGYGWYMQESNGGPNSQMVVVNSVFSNSTNDGINSQSGFAANGDLNLFMNSIFYGNGGYGLNIPFPGGCLAAVGDYGQTAYNNGVGANGSGNYLCVTSYNDVALTANPFVSSSNFALNSTAGGGAALKAAGIPGVALFGTGYSAIGALQPQATSSSGGGSAYVQ